ncbi:MAG: hypothetical protein K1X89_09530 [Myxococcaceae bacterium]|nr:hypothetical protein [Myxococcaceae bacterium]
MKTIRAGAAKVCAVGVVLGGVLAGCGVGQADPNVTLGPVPEGARQAGADTSGDQASVSSALTIPPGCQALTYSTGYCITNSDIIWSAMYACGMIGGTPTNPRYVWGDCGVKGKSQRSGLMEEKYRYGMVTCCGL